MKVPRAATAHPRRAGVLNAEPGGGYAQGSAPDPNTAHLGNAILAQATKVRRTPYGPSPARVAQHRGRCGGDRRGRWRGRRARSAQSSFGRRSCRRCSTRGLAPAGVAGSRRYARAAGSGIGPAPARGQRRGCDRSGQERHRAAQQHPCPGAVVTGHRADDGGADGRAADKDEHVQAHDPATQLRVDGKLNRGVRHRLAHQVDEAHRRQQHQEDGDTRRERRRRLEDAEYGRRAHDGPGPGPAGGPGQHRAGRRPEPEHDIEQPVGAGVAAEGRLGHRGEHDREVQAERAEHPHEEDRPQHLGSPAHVPDRLPDRAASPGGGRGRPQVGRAQHEQADGGTDVAGGVDREHPAGADADDEQAGDGRPDQPGCLEHGGGQRDRGAQPVRGYHFGDE